MTILGIDYGRSHLGLSIGHTETKMALPYMTLNNLSYKDFLIQLKKVINEEKIEKIIIGWPIATNPDNETPDGIRSEVESFSNKVKGDTHILFELIDERYSTAAAARLRHDDPKSDEHSIAAMLILQSYFDRL